MMEKKKKGSADRNRWRDEIGGFVRVTWNRQAADRDEWRSLGEAFVMQGIQRGW